MKKGITLLLGLFFVLGIHGMSINTTSSNVNLALYLECYSVEIGEWRKQVKSSDLMLSSANWDSDSIPEITPTNLDIYLVIGQSNMAGRATIEEDQKKILEGTYLFTGQGEVPWVLVSNPLNRFSTVRKEMSMQRLSPAYSFAKEIKAHLPEQEVGLVVNARGGTKIVQWLPGANLYEEAIGRTKKALKYGNLKGVIWHQGESDKDLLRTGMYLARIEVIVNALREEFEDPNLPFVAGELFETDRTKAFNAMMSQLPQFISNTALVSSAGTAVFDKVHFDNASQNLLGERYAKAMLKIQSKQK